MRHFKTDVSHRIKRRPSIFTAMWFRVILGVGTLIILGLLVGPTVLGWLRSNTRPTVAATRTSPPSRAATTPATAASRPETPSTGTAAAPAPPVATTPASPVPSAPPAPSVAPATAAVPVSPRASSPEPANGAARPSESRSAPAASTTPARATAPAVEPSATAPGSGSAVYRIQVGAFLDHRNADRLIERLRGEGVEVVNSIVEESRVLYRVLATPPDGGAYPALAERLQSLGFTPEPADNGLAVTRPLPLRSAVDLSRRLKEQGIPVRLDRQASSAAFRVVRVGAYASTDEAERARAEMATRGYEGIVVRETR
jgi:cell division protein FtsN